MRTRGVTKGVAWLFHFPIESDQTTFIVAGLDDAQALLAEGASYSVSVSSPSNLTVEPIGAGEMDCRGRLSDFDGGSVLETPVLTKAEDLTLPVHVTAGIPTIVWAWIGADMEGRVEIVDPDGNVQAWNATGAIGPGQNAFVFGCLSEPGEWTVRIPYLMSITRPFAYAASTSAPGLEPEAIDCPILGTEDRS